MILKDYIYSAANTLAGLGKTKPTPDLIASLVARYTDKRPFLNNDINYETRENLIQEAGNKLLSLFNAYELYLPVKGQDLRNHYIRVLTMMVNAHLSFSSSEVLGSVYKGLDFVLTPSAESDLFRVVRNTLKGE